MSIDERRLGRLLAGRDQPSVLEKEAVFDAVMKSVERPRRRLLPWGGAIALAAAALLLWFPRAAEHEFGARGGGLGGVFVPHCSNRAATGACTAGSTLALELEPPEGRPHVALFARRPDGATVWYFPGTSERMPSVAEQRSGRLWQRAARIAEDAPLGTYTLYLVFSERALSRSELKDMLGPELRGGGELSVVARVLEVQAAP